jgi:hypothetical protein
MKSIDVCIPPQSLGTVHPDVPEIAQALKIAMIWVCSGLLSIAGVGGMENTCAPQHSSPYRIPGL